MEELFRVETSKNLFEPDTTAELKLLELYVFPFQACSPSRKRSKQDTDCKHRRCWTLRDKPQPQSRMSSLASAGSPANDVA